MIYQKELYISTSGHRHLQDLTPKLEKVLSELNVSTGFMNIFNVGSTAAIASMEFEPGLEVDLPEMLDRLAPPDKSYAHEQTWHDGNGHSHLQACLLSPSITVPIRNGRLVLGTWQQIVHIECDIKPHEKRPILLTIYAE